MRWQRELAIMISVAVIGIIAVAVIVKIEGLVQLQLADQSYWVDRAHYPALSERLNALCEEELAQLEAELQRGLSGSEQLAQRGISRYADWHFSVQGSLIQQAALIAQGLSASGRLMSAAFIEEEPRLRQISQQIDRALRRTIFEESGAEEALAGELSTLTAQTQRQRRLLLARFEGELSAASSVTLARGGFIDTLLEGLVPPTPPLSAPGVKLTLSALGGGVGARLFGTIFRRLGHRILLKNIGATAVKTGVKRGAGALAGAASAATVCAPTGPGALACGVAGFAIGFLAAEVTVTELDELMNRETFEASLRRELQQSYGTLRGALLEETRALQRRLTDQQGRVGERPWRLIDQI